MTTRIPALPARDAVDRIAELLRDPQWGVGMLEDIEQIIKKAGGDTQTRYFLVAWHCVSLDQLPSDAPLDPRFDPENLPNDIAHWHQTGTNLTDGYWTSEPNATQYRGEPEGWLYDRDGARRRLPKDAMLYPIPTWWRH